MCPSHALPTPFLEEPCDASVESTIPNQEHMYDVLVANSIQELGYRVDCLAWICTHHEEVCELCAAYVQAIRKDIERAGMTPELETDLLAAEQEAKMQQKKLRRNHQVLYGLEQHTTALKTQQLDYYAGVLTQREYVSVR